MRIAIISDAFPPMRTSAAIQLRDLAHEFHIQGHELTILLPSSEINSWSLEAFHDFEVLRLKAPKIKDVNYIRRTLAEFLMPFFMIYFLNKSPFANSKWGGIVWYSPTIFFGPFVRSLKKKSACKSYLIVRDIFPEWAVNVGMLSRGLTYRFFKAVENYQYSVADNIGVQSPGELTYFSNWAAKQGRYLEVLHNWIAEAPNVGCTISISKTNLAGRFIFVYAGNIGVARSMDVLIDFISKMTYRSDIGFLFVGRGSEMSRLISEAKKRSLDNVLFHNEIDPSEIPGLYAQCHVGILALDPRHRTQNIPGKFLTYMQAGLPVLASINKGNDLVDLIPASGVGRVSTDCSVDSLEQMTIELVEEILRKNQFKDSCNNLLRRLYRPSCAVNKILNCLINKNF
jgi:glycosyltransferase involved in cell wall biosynthesis